MAYSVAVSFYFFLLSTNWMPSFVLGLGNKRFFFLEEFHIRLLNQKPLTFRGSAHGYLNQSITPSLESCPHTIVRMTFQGFGSPWSPSTGPASSLEHSHWVGHTGCGSSGSRRGDSGRDRAAHKQQSDRAVLCEAKGLRYTEVKWAVKGIFNEDITFFVFRWRRYFYNS